MLAQKKEHGVEITQKFIDMRGPQVRVLTNLENLNAEIKFIDDQTPMPKLQHTVKLILDNVGVDIEKFDNKNLRHESEWGVALQREQEATPLERDCMAETTTR